MLGTAENLVFKQEISPSGGWIHYGLVIAVLVILMVVLAKKFKPTASKITGCQLIDKKHLSNKTVVYVIEYEQQRFILADNQQALAIHPLEKTIKVDQPLAPERSHRKPKLYEAADETV